MSSINTCTFNRIMSRATRRTAIFDMDGTLVETDAANNAAYSVAANRAGVMGIAGFYGRITSEVIARSADWLRKSDVDAIVAMKVVEYCKHLWMLKLGVAAHDLECVLLNREYFGKVVLLTDSEERRAMETLAHFGMTGCFDEIVCNAGKGDKYVNYFTRFDTDPAASVVWENEDGKIRSAIAAGVKMENTRKVG